MKKKFLTIFLEILSETAEAIDITLSRESFHYKMLRRGGHNPRQIYDGFKNLEKRKIIRTDSNNFRMTTKGKLWFGWQRFKQLSIHDSRWEHKWRVIIFDIPEPMKKQRDIFRRKLKVLGLYLLQKSVFVYPFSCEEELGFLANYLEIGEYVDVIIADTIGFKEDQIKKHFGL